MNYNKFSDDTLSALGFGLMRLPEKDGAVDIEQTRQMIHTALNNGVNYFDTAWPYHDGLSESVCGEILSHYPRTSYRLADKFPGHQQLHDFSPAPIFERQLQKCCVEYFDYYLMHNVCEESIDVYLDPKWGLLNYFLEQKQQGRIRHLGFSTHGETDCIRRFLDSEWGPHMEFCQIQLNYLDWTIQNAEDKVRLLNERNIPIWVMEGLRGGMLAKNGVDKAFRWLQQIPGVTMTLSGMSTIAQMEENIQTFSDIKPLTVAEQQQLATFASGLHDFIPCTGCRYCCSECQQQLNIPSLLSMLNDMRMGGTITPMMYLETLPVDRQASACVACGNCKHACPQNIDIPALMSELADRYASGVKWSAICEERNKKNTMP